MGSWGTGIFDNDTAFDMENEFETYLSEGLSIKEATNKLLTFPTGYEPGEDEVEIYLIAAALQLDYNNLQPNIKEKALNSIEKDLQHWIEGANAETAEERKQVLEELKIKLLEYKPNQETKPPVKSQARNSFVDFFYRGGWQKKNKSE